MRPKSKRNPAILPPSEEVYVLLGSIVSLSFPYKASESAKTSTAIYSGFEKKSWVENLKIIKYAFYQWLHNDRL